MANTSLEEILSLTDRDISDHEAESISRFMDTEGSTKDEVKLILAHKDCADHIDNIISAVERLNTYDVSAEQIAEVLNPDITYSFINTASNAVHKGVTAEQLKSVTDMILSDESHPYNRAESILGCMEVRAPIKDYSIYSNSQIVEFNYVFTDIVADCERNYSTNREVCGREITDKFNSVVRAGILDPALTSSQIFELGSCAGLHLHDYKGNSLKEAVNLIKNHITCRELYNTALFEIRENLYSESEAWQNAKGFFYDNREQYALEKAILKAGENVISPARKDVLAEVCYSLGFSQNEIDSICEKSDKLIFGNNSKCYALCEMLMENIPPDDAIDYLQCMQTYESPVKEALFECVCQGLPKELTEECLKCDMTMVKANEVICGFQNGLSNDEIKSYCQPGMTAFNMCKQRVGLEKQHAIEKGESSIGASLKANSELADKMNTNKKKQVNKTKAKDNKEH